MQYSSKAVPADRPSYPTRPRSKRHTCHTADMQNVALRDLLHLMDNAHRTGHVDTKTRRIVNLPWDWVRSDGVYGKDGDHPWVYCTIPTVPLAWSDRDERLIVGERLHQMLAALGATSRIPMANMPSFANNRRVHMISITLSSPPILPSNTSPELRELLDEVLEVVGDVPRRVCMIGVQCLGPNLMDAEQIEGVSVDRMVELGKVMLGIASSSIEQYQDDIDLIKGTLYKSGARPPSNEERGILESWYNRGNGNGTLIKVHPTWIDVQDSDDKLEFATIRRFEVPVRRGTRWTWAQAAASHPAGAIVISVRGELEPAAVVVKRMLAVQRRQRSHLQDISQSGDLMDLTQIDKFDLQRDAEGIIRSQAEAVLVKTSIVMGRYANKAIENYTDMLNNQYQIKARPHWNRQISALEETLPCSGVSLSRFEQPMNLAALAFAGMGSFGELGDKSGLLVGMVDPDLSLCWLDPWRASRGSAREQSPGVAILGDSGSGKRLSLDTEMPTPTGKTTMGQLQIGDQVLDRHGNPCTVRFISETEPNPDLYEISFSDGQKILADKDHQWIVSSRHPHHQTAIVNWQRRQAEIQKIQRLAGTYNDDTMLTSQQILDLLHRHRLAKQWRNRAYMKTVLDFVGCPYVVASRNDGGEHGEMPARACLYPAATALKSVAIRLQQQAGPQPREGQYERILTTGDIIQEGLLAPTKIHWLNFSIPAARPLRLPEADLLIDPWLLGAWLGDGNRRTHQIYTHVDDLDEMARLVELHSGVPVRTKMADPDDEASPNKATIFWPTPDGNEPFLNKLRDLNLYCNKHIPMQYLRASFEQRLAILQGLMDTDGSITVKGECILSLSDRQLAFDAVTLIRSMGIVVHPRKFKGKRCKDQKDRPKGRREWVAKPGWRMCFTTNLPVFKLARKVARIPTGPRSPKQSRIFITDIRPVAPVPARCIQVDSPDGSYLCGDFIITHNTFLMQWLCLQSVFLGRRAVYFNPKPKDNLVGLVELVGRYRPAELITVGDVSAQPGAFDPFRYAPRHAHLIAAEFIGDVLGPDLDGHQQIQLSRGLQDAMNAGVQCVGEALKYFVKERQVVDAVLGLAETNPIFALGIAMQPRPPLTTGGGLTLIQFDQSWPDVEPIDVPSQMPISDRVLLALQRLIPRAALELLLATGEGGDLYLDEAHRLLGSAAGRKFAERMGKEGRSGGIMTVLGTHKPSEIIDAGMAGYMGRIIALKQQNRFEAAKAFEMVHKEPTPERLESMESWGPIAPDSEGGVPKPAQCLMRDLDGRSALVTIYPVPARIIAALSTSRPGGPVYADRLQGANIT